VNDARIINRDNIARCCFSCNASKGTKKLSDWLESDYCKKRGITKDTVAEVVNRALVSQPTIFRDGAFRIRIDRGSLRSHDLSLFGRRIEQKVSELRKFLMGWKAYFGFSEVKSIFRELDSWIKRRLRCYLWKQWGRKGDRELRKRGVSRDLAWNTAKSPHGPWRLSRSPGLAFALPAKYFASLGVSRLFIKTT
jgi:hypothetical protein